MHSHSHNHSHSHSHSHDGQNNIKTAIFLNVTFTIIELIGGLLTNSLAILSDALHDLGDSIVLIFSYFAEKKAHQKPDSKRTYGYQRLSLLAALSSAIILLTGSVFILIKAFERLQNPSPVHTQGMIFLAILGILFNGLGMLKLLKGKTQNQKVLSWHLLEDVLGWTVILIGSLTMLVYPNPIIDPIMTIGFSLFLIWGVFRNLKETINIFMQGVPANLDTNQIHQELLKIEGIEDLHDLHIWSLDGENNILTAHITTQTTDFNQLTKIRQKINQILKSHNIDHSTIELEPNSIKYCSGSC